MSRGPLGWAKERTVWGLAVDMATGLALSLGFFGQGEPAKQAREDVRRWLRGHREQTLGPVLDAVEVSMEKGTPIWKDSTLWVPVVTMAAQFLPVVQGKLPPGSTGWIIVGCLVVIAQGLMSRKRTEETIERRLTAGVEREVAVEQRGLIEAKRSLVIEEGRLLRAGGTVHSTAPFPDGPVSR